MWCSDVHLDIAYNGAIVPLLDSIHSGGEPTGLLLTGDIDNGLSISEGLTELVGLMDVPVHFVLGNHDYYHRSIASVREEMVDITSTEPRLVWLSNADPTRVSDGVVLVGHDGWADGTAGIGIESSPVRLNDELLIDEQAACTDRAELARLVKRLADEGTGHLKRLLDGLDRETHHVILATHVPPFETACLHKGRPSGADFLPHFCNPSLGDMLVEHVEAHPGRRITVLAGHTHDRAFDQPHPQIDVHVAGAAYGAPAVEGAISIGLSGQPLVELRTQ